MSITNDLVSYENQATLRSLHSNSIYNSHSKGHFMHYTILLAHHERSIRRYCGMELESAGYNVLLADDGVDAIGLADTFAIDLVVIDDNIPRCNVVEAARRMKAMNASLPVVLYTADRDGERCQSPYVDATIIKSDDLSELKSLIVTLLAPQRTSRSCQRYDSCGRNHKSALSNCQVMESVE